MANIHIARHQQSLGSFSEEEIREGIRTGRFSADDLSWREGMPAWKPLGEMAPQWGLENPPPSLEVVVDPLPASKTSDGNEPAWEDRERLGLFPAILKTVEAVLMRPSQTFAAMKQTGGLAHPLLYFVLLSSTMFAVSAIYQMAATTLNPVFAPPQLSHTSKTSFFVAMIGSILVSPALYVVSSFISSGITHLCLKLLGGAHKPFETTFRVICYAQASASVLNLLPLCGSLIGLICGAYCIIIGLKEAHGTEGWRATVAITLPGLLCCGLFLLAAAAAGVGIAELGKGFGGMPQLPKFP